MIPFSALVDATVHDPTLVFTQGLRRALAARYRPASRFSRRRLFDAMYHARTVVFDDYPMRPSRRFDEGSLSALITELQTGLPQRERTLIRTGRSRTPRRVTVRQALERWLRGRSRFGVTDLHFRGTRFYDRVDAAAISYFNLLPKCSEALSFLEMLTLVISSKGIFSDSHSDDGDGSNHCFVGKKLWLAWDRHEGQKAGLQDCTFDRVDDQCSFDMATFARLRSSHWFLVTEHQTLFMPGHFTHKVVTLEPYIGFGSFYVSMPSYINTIKRWLLHATTDVDAAFVEHLNNACTGIVRTLAAHALKEQNRLGLPYLRRAARNWRRGLTARQCQLLLGNRSFRTFLLAALDPEQ